MLSTLFVLVTLGFVLAVGPADATVLTFDSLGVGNSNPIPPAYGDKVNPTCGGSGCCDSAGCYDQGNGFTPNISVGYRTVDASTGGTTVAQLEYWDTSYGDLTGVAFGVNNGQLGEISLVPEPGYTVILNSFDLGGYPLTDVPGQTVRVLDANDAVLVDFSLLLIEGDAGHTQVVPAPAIVAAGEIKIQFGPNWYVAIDNVNFDQGFSNELLQCQDDLADTITDAQGFSNALVQCQDDLADVTSDAQGFSNALVQCQDDLAGAVADADQDGKRDLDDTCAGSASGVAVDTAGCSLGQFCSAIDATTRLGKRICKRADWTHDEPIMKKGDRDCATNRGGRGSADDRCVPTSN